VIGFQTPAADTGQPSPSRSQQSTPVLSLWASVFSRFFQPSACGGHQLPGSSPTGGHQPLTPPG
jgi:hypothetical protein